MLIFLLTACEVMVGFPDISNYEGDYVKVNDEYFATPAGCMFNEDSSNEDDELLTIGTFIENDYLQICGNMSSGGINSSNQYSGDIDIYYFTVLSKTSMYIELDWTDSYSYLDFALFVIEETESEMILYQEGYNKPKYDSQTVYPGDYFLRVASSSGSSDYVLDITTD